MTIYDYHHEYVNSDRREFSKMKVSREQMARNRARILSEAGRLFREKGFSGVSVAEVMKAAGLTHGGFYGHFKSKDELIAEVLAQSGIPQVLPDGLPTMIEAYLSPAHRESPSLGCSLAALAGLMRDQAPEARAAMGRRLSEQIGNLERSIPGTEPQDRRRAAIGTLAAMVGALILSRSVDDPDLASELLAETRDWLAARN